METRTEENYLKVIYTISDNSSEVFSTKVIAEHINSKPSSVTNMIQRLSLKNLVHYKKYKGVSLTEKGKNKALQIIRKHRLWELFLVEHLNFSWSEVHEIAEQLEHVSSPLLVNRLDSFLNYPARDPHGDIIPNEDGNMRNDNTILLSKVLNEQSCIITRIKNSSTEFLVCLDNLGIGLGTELQVLELFPYDNSKRAKVDEKNIISLSDKICNNLYVELKRNQ